MFVNLLHGHAASENGGHSQVPTVTGIASGHHVFGVKHLLGQFWDSQRPGKINKKFVKLTDLYYASNSLTNFECERMQPPEKENVANLLKKNLSW